ncbi:MAG: pyruvate carboxylase [Gemmatimonadota bacterium]|nr:pyruvate carboxylase [Gemmatimonadota bacterium]MDH3422176.1 pyruvate carboxylase [Gemmatimonadota bacterium]
MTAKVKEFERVMAANRGEIAIRVFRACTELGKRTIALYSEEDSLALHRYKADEAYLIPSELGPVEAYLDIEAIVSLAVEKKVDAIHPGYGFLSENADFARRCAEEGIVFIGPSPEQLNLFGDKISARELALAAGLPVVPGTPEPVDDDEAIAFAEEIGYPVMVKAAAGGGGRGMRRAKDLDELRQMLPVARREATTAFGRGDLYVEKLVRNPRHIEVQILADKHGRVEHLWERDCSIQRRHQKVVEIAPAMGLDPDVRMRICTSAKELMLHAGYQGAGTVEFLLEPNGDFFFIEVNPRIQVEHTVTELVMGVDLVQAQIKVAEGSSLADIGIPDEIPEPNGYAIQCRVTTEDPENDFLPDAGRITHYRSPGGFGVRLDGATAFTGAIVSPHYDSLLVKVCTYALSFEDAIRKMRRALMEFRIRGLKTNIRFLEKVVTHPDFAVGDSDTGFIAAHPELLDFLPRRDRGTRLLRYIGHIAVNGQVEGPKGRTKPDFRVAPLPAPAPGWTPPTDTLKRVLDSEGPAAVVERLKKQKQVLFMDTTFRDAHQSLLATRMRSFDLQAVARDTGRLAPNLFSMEVWGGATFDTSYRFLKEDPWERLAKLRERIPHIMFQMLLRGQSLVGYSAYPDNAVQAFVKEAADAGIDVFRIFDSLNWVPNMQISIDAVRAQGKIAEVALCYTGDVLDKSRTRYDLAYYVALAQEIEKAGADILAIKDMAGLLKPGAAKMLIEALRDATDLPVHLHTHDSTGVGVATSVQAALAGAAVVDGCIDSLAGGTSQPSLRAIAAALQGSERESDLDLDALQPLNEYWSTVRSYYSFLERGSMAPDAHVFRTQVPGGQFTNLKHQAEALGLLGQWRQVVRSYREADALLGELIKVTPSSKAVGDLALFMVQNDLDGEELLRRAPELSFPESVVGLLKGRLGRPPYGFPEQLQAAVLRGEKPLEDRPGAYLDPVDFDAVRREVTELMEDEPVTRPVTDREVLSRIMFPEVYREFAAHRAAHGDTSALDTPTFFYGPAVGSRVAVDIEEGKTLIIRLISIGDVHADGTRPVVFELNGHAREVRIRDLEVSIAAHVRAKAEPGNWQEVGASMPGKVVKILVQAGETVPKGGDLLVTEAMKMETSLRSPRHAVVEEVLTQQGDAVDAGDLLMRLGPVPETEEV